MSRPELASVQAVAHGYVQGVFFRAYVSRKAAELGLTGYVRNLAGGGVEVYAEGERGRLEQLIAHLQRGPSAARVDRVETRWSEYSGRHSSFDIRY